MSRLTKTLRALGSLVRNPWLLNHVLAADEVAWQRQALAHAAGRHSLTAQGLPTVALTSFLPPSGDTVQPFAFRDGGSLPTDLALLRGLARSITGCRYFEIGTWRGESAANVAEVVKSVHTLNLSAAEMRAMGLPARYAELHGFFSKDLANVQHLYGNSATYDLSGLGQAFDLIFIDGDHHYEAVRMDTRRVFEHLVHPRTIVVWHDAARQPGQPRWEVLAGIMAGLPPDAGGQLVQVANTLCAMYLPEPLLASAPNPLADPVPAFSVHIQPQ
ncbi:class I SAM-dependent methyltransferase [Hymenobacter radiodurans]|uniref:class I SAM-dependent methyltransferase n=1 Tax=Hymenobacter radiodurans TaxID=2496028 RepID=UPI0010585C5B|nr:class I SAM-dependent methyltransferase [Hymenobacter radiodurans]